MENKELLIREILKLDAEVASIEVRIYNIRKEICAKFYPQYAKRVRIKFMYYDKIKYGIINFVTLDSYNPYLLKINVKPTRKSFLAIERAVVHSVNILEKDVLRIL